jgi:hypothetical protein
MIIVIILADFQVLAPMPMSEKGRRKSTRPELIINTPTAKERLLARIGYMRL